MSEKTVKQEKLVKQEPMESTKGVDLGDNALMAIAGDANSPYKMRAQIAGVYSTALKKGVQLTQAARSGAERSGYIPGIMKSKASEGVVREVRDAAKNIFAELKKEKPNEAVVKAWMETVKHKLRDGGGKKAPLTDKIKAADFFA